MPFSLVPYAHFSDIYELTPALLQAAGVSLLLLDLDNTISPYREVQPSAPLLAWLESLRAAGITPFVLSNSRKKTRVGDFAKAADLAYIRHAGKPKKGGFLAALAQMDCAPEACLMVGDQIFTDILGANRAGLRSLLVRPLRQDTIFRKIRFGLETPFRAACKRRGFL